MATSHLMRNSTFVYAGLRLAEVSNLAYGSRRGPVAPRPASQPARQPASQPGSRARWAGRLEQPPGPATAPANSHQARPPP